MANPEHPFSAGDPAWEVVASSRLPAPVRARLCAILNALGPGDTRREDVARELVAHFEDGLEAGRTVEELLEGFGDEHAAGAMIHRQKRRQDPVEHALERGRAPWDALVRNLRYSLRRLRQCPGFTATAVLSLALGIGANAAIFSLVNAVLLRPEPLHEPHRLVKVYTTSSFHEFGMSAYPDFEDLRDATRDVFTGMVASVTTMGQVDRQGTVETVLGEATSGNRFALLGVDAAVGRTLTAEDDVEPGGHPVVMISHRYWRRAFAGDPEVIGRELRINGRQYTVVGVTPADFHGSLLGLEPDIYAPAMMYDELEFDTRTILETRASRRFQITARLGPGVNLVQAQAAADRVADQMRERLGWTEEDGFVVVPDEDVIVHPPLDRFVRASAWLLVGVVGLVLLVACSNLAGFLLARSLDRRKEVAVRLAIGASRRSLVFQLLTETTLLSLLAGAAGVALAGGLLTALSRADLPLPIPVTLDLRLDPIVFGFSLAVSVATGVLLGLVPAVHSTRLQVAPTLQDEGSGRGSSRRRLNLRNALVAVQVAVCLVLLVGAGLFLRSLHHARAVDPGFGHEPAAMLVVAVSPQQYTPEEGRVLMGEILERVEQIPGVHQAGITHNMLLRKTGRDTMEVEVAGMEPPPGHRYHMVDTAIVDAGFFSAVGIPIVRGRGFTRADRADTQRVAVISAAMAARFWPGNDAIGRTFRQHDGTELRVVGVARDAKVLDLSETPRPFLYLPYSQSYTAMVQVIARTGRDPEQVALEMVATAREVDPELVLWAPTTMARHLGFVLLPARLSAWILSAFAVLAVALACLGLYGAVSYSVSQRAREVGIRMSLGATGRSVVVMLVGSGMRLVAVGGLAGLAVAFLLARTVSGLLFGVEANDVLTFALATAALATVAAAAAFAAALRASRIDPAEALRAE